MNENNLGLLLKKRREEKELTLKELGRLSGVSASYIGRVELDERRPSAGVLRKLAGHLGYEEAELLKMYGYLSPDQTDDRIAKMKSSMKQEIAETMTGLMEKVDSL